MDIGIAIFSSVFGSAGLFGLIQFLISRHDSKSRDMSQIKHQLSIIEQKCERNELATTRLQLIFLIQSQPKNSDTILQTAQRYFVELDGNGEAWAVFYHWAEENHLDLGWYKALIQREERRKQDAEHN